MKYLEKPKINSRESIEVTWMNRAIFLDRDGTINIEIGYLHEPEKFQFEYKVPEALQLLQKAGFKLIKVTNQGAIARGMYTKEDMDRTHAFMQQELKKQGVTLDRIYFCPHLRTDNCSCRKPEPGMILQGIKDFQIDPTHSWMIGDKLKDIEAGKRAGVNTILVATGYGVKEREEIQLMEKCARSPYIPTVYAANLWEAANIIVRDFAQ
jgi:D-glycero-D-manno-heptose 1,7-bisphosphate phosphatase